MMLKKVLADTKTLFQMIPKRQRNLIRHNEDRAAKKFAVGPTKRRDLANVECWLPLLPKGWVSNKRDFSLISDDSFYCL